MRKLIIVGNKTNKLISFLKQAKNSGFKAELVAADYDDSKDDELRDEIGRQNVNIKQITDENKELDSQVSEKSKLIVKLESKALKNKEDETVLKAEKSTLKRTVKNLEKKIKTLEKKIKTLEKKAKK